ncbi:DUF2849 domain-containing protein [Terasakiella sp. A23]|uniref:DUF2849 domain-containing protein n=1 Tax=Terasakiella sp. FCG-A23 TaxID=3080561 RepID=UPI0029544299|nr:DUF2849 domain-containing protein [Terasakiella sp. A23]MDV7340176.1 DUF2849 domain-containing protein [Terasakiella sp. A23]
MTKQVVTANRLDDGLAVFYDKDGQWNSSICEAASVESGENGDKLLAQASDDANQLLVVGPYLIDVDEVEGKIVPVRYREQIRTTGPSIRPDLGNQVK